MHASAHRVRRNAGCSLAVATATLVFAGPASADSRYVRSGGSDSANDGTGWVSAYRTLSRALVDLNAGGSTVDSILVAGRNDAEGFDGVYKPIGANGSFVVKKACKIQGVFKGVGMDPGTRDPIEFQTTLSGDLNGDDDGTEAKRQDNSFHVLKLVDGIVDTTTIDGFTISAGNARGTGEDSQGGGIRTTYGGSTGAEVRATDCRFIGNRARDQGGALDSYRRPVRLRRCVFDGNVVTGDDTSGGGGAVYTTNALYIIECLFQNNSVLGTAGRGGAAANIGCSADISNSTFLNNHATGDSTHSQGGGLAITGNLSIRSCLFAGNTSTARGGAVHSDGFDFSTLRNCTLIGHSAGADGGGVLAVSGFSGAFAIHNSILRDNTAGTSSSDFDKQVHLT